AALFGSASRLSSWADWWQVWPGHGAGSACGKGLSDVPQTTVGYERRHNAQLAAVRDGAEPFARQILAGQNEPPLYFARVKRANHDGVPGLKSVPRPVRVRPEDFPAGAVVLDTRPDRSAFMRGHLPGALHAPLDAGFCTTVGSLVPDPETPLALVVEADQMDAAVRALVRIGFDRVESFATPADVAASGRETGRIEEVGAESVRARVRAGGAVLDVRYGPERAAGAIPGSIHVPYTRLADHVDRVPRGRPVLVHCASGVRSASASAFLAGRGVDVVYVNGSVAPLYEDA
ncbi:MAG TPA: rhodanese-like domain-containing protein, partial [Rubricoccaceae bacterium]